MSILKKHSTLPPESWNKEIIKSETKMLIDEISSYIEKLYAAGKESVLIVLQGMDGSGKDGLTKDLFEGISPSWVNVQAFKKPTDLEMSHDYLWRIHQKLPEKGMITVFNRSHYEDILVPSVYKFIDDKIILSRYRQINDFERMLQENGTHILKFYMHLSYEKQEVKLRERIEMPEKHWKHADGDWDTREHWNEFMEVYETIFSKCNEVPWHFLPCDTNWGKLYVAATALLEKLKQINPQFPPLETKRF